MNPWKVTTIGIALVTVTALTTGLTTAYFIHPTATAADTTVATAPVVHRAPVVNAVTRAPEVAPARVVRTTTVAAPPVRPVAVSTTPVDCATTGDRVWRIAKPGLVGGLVGAGVGAATGAIAGGGSGAAKGAGIAGIAGAVLGGAYGAYQTKQECGSVFGGNGYAEAASPVTYGVPVASTQSAFGPAATNGITVYNAR